jgi:single-strand DNA-binding protein
MANLNKTFLMGNLTRDPELRHTAAGNSVCNFSVAVNRTYRQNDELKKDVQFFNIVAWNKIGENCSKYLAKGRPVLVEGRLQNRSYKTDDGQKRYITEIVADNVQFLSSGRQSSETNNYNTDDNYTGSDDEGVPF